MLTTALMLGATPVAQTAVRVLELVLPQVTVEFEVLTRAARAQATSTPSFSPIRTFLTLL